MIGTDGIYSAGAGYDIATGLGTPNASSLCNILSNNIKKYNLSTNFIFFSQPCL